MQVVDKGHDLAGGQLAADDLQAATPDDDHDADVDTGAQRRAHGCHPLHDADVALRVVLVADLETPGLVFIAHERLDDAHAGDVLLQDSVEPVQLLLQSEIERPHLENEEHDQHQRDQQQRHQRQRQARVSVVHQHHAAEHDQRRARPDAQRDLHQSLEDVRVAGQSHHQLTGLHAVEVAEGKGLDRDEQRLAQIARHPLTHLNRVDVVADGEDRIEGRDDKHQQEGPPHHLHVAGNDALIDDTLHQSRDGQIQNDHHDQQKQRKNACLPVRSDETKQLEDLLHGE